MNWNSPDLPDDWLDLPLSTSEPLDNNNDNNQPEQNRESVQVREEQNQDSNDILDMPQLQAEVHHDWIHQHEESQHSDQGRLRNVPQHDERNPQSPNHLKTITKKNSPPGSFIKEITSSSTVATYSSDDIRHKKGFLFSKMSLDVNLCNQTIPTITAQTSTPLSTEPFDIAKRLWAQKYQNCQPAIQEDLDLSRYYFNPNGKLMVPQLVTKLASPMSVYQGQRPTRLFTEWNDLSIEEKEYWRGIWKVLKLHQEDQHKDRLICYVKDL